MGRCGDGLEDPRRHVKPRNGQHAYKPATVEWRWVKTVSPGSPLLVHLVQCSVRDCLKGIRGEREKDTQDPSVFTHTGM